jgi:PhnB protein
MTFYKECLGGKLTFQTAGESPLSSKMTKKMRNVVLHASLQKEKLVLMASDIVEEKGLKHGNTVSLLLNCSSEKEIKVCYKKLSQDGEQTHPLAHTAEGALLGNLVDRYGHQWTLYFKNNTLH